MTFFEGSLHNPSHQKIAIDMVKEGKPVVLMFRGTFGIFGDGGKQSFVDSVIQIKGGGRLGAPLAAVFSAEKLIPMLDKSQLPDSYWMTNITEVKARLSTLCFVRVHITKEAAKSLPSSMLSYTESGLPIIQNWFPHGLPIEKIAEQVDFPAVTSTNYHGEPEIVEAESVAGFCTLTNIPVFLKDEKYPKRGVKGSYTIFSIHKDVIKAEREGNIPAETFKYIFGTEINISGAAAAKHPQLKFPVDLFKGLSPLQARQAIILYAEGRFPRRVKHIRRKVTDVK
jgi:tRNA A37 threonylcarbamoyladenosine synthetase subunit TsaC/SUA5/YrdC